MQYQSYRQSLTTNGGYNSTSVNKQWPLPLFCESVHTSSRQDERENLATDDSPSHENREMKDMYTNSPADEISKMPEPFKTAIQNTKQWQWERKKGLKSTGCWATLFPKDESQDVSFTIWCGHGDGESLTQFFGGQLEILSHSRGI